MTLLAIFAVFSFAIATTGAIIAGYSTVAMIGEINRKRADDQQVSYFGIGPMWGVNVFSEYRRLYPQGRLHLFARAAIALVAIGAVGVGVCLCLWSVISPPPPSRPVGLG